MEIKRAKAKQEMQNKEKRKSDTVIRVLELEQMLSEIVVTSGKMVMGLFLQEI